MSANLRQEHGLHPIEQGGGGNCLFHSLAFFFRDSHITHIDMRRRLCEYMLANRETYQIGAIGAGFDNIDIYVANMLRLGTWGDGTVIQAFSNLFQVNVCIFNDQQIYQTLPTSKLKIALLWDRKSMHYQPLLPSES